MTTQTLSISPRGQITLPKKIRDLFKSDTIVLKLLDNEHVIISPVPDVGGDISHYTKKTDLTSEEIRNMSWSDSRNNQENK